MMVEKPVGIDLGTTYSVVAYVDDSGRPTTVPNSLGEILTRSAVFVDAEELIVGSEAVKASVIEPDACAECFKRDMGAAACHRPVRGRRVPPEVMSGFVLRRLKQDAEKRLGSLRQAVVTVPAFFDETRRRATQEAGRLAGLDVLDIINEPTAAALAFGYQQGMLSLTSPQPSNAGRRILVYDLGGGTFDVTILEMGGHEFRALATDGDVRLGGKDFDERLVNFLAQVFLDRHGADPRSDPQDAAQLWQDAMEAKHALSERRRTSVVLHHAGIRMRVELTREQFQELTRDLTERTEATTSLVLKEAGLSWSEIDRVLLVGGATRMPAVSEMLLRLSGRQPDGSVSPDEAVAHGAALYADALLGQPGGKRTTAPCQLKNVNSHSLGVAGIHPQTGKRTNVILIPKNSPIPCRVSRTFRTAMHDQRSARIVVLEGESHRPDECIALGECVVRDLPPGLPQGTPIEVEYSYAANGRISVAARVRQARQSALAAIERQQGEDLGTLEAWELRLTGRGEAEPQAADAEMPPGGRREAWVRRLDDRFTQIGKAASRVPLPDVLRNSQQAAQAAASRLATAEKALSQAQTQQAAAFGSVEARTLGTQLAQAQEACKLARTQAQFAFLVLGRECLEQGVRLAGAESAVDEARVLLRQLEQAE